MRIKRTGPVRKLITDQTEIPTISGPITHAAISTNECKAASQQPESPSDLATRSRAKACRGLFYVCRHHESST